MPFVDRRSGAAFALSRRTFLLAAPFALAACQAIPVGLPDQPDLPGEDFDYDLAYAAVEEDGHKIPAVNYKAFDRQFWRQVVDYKTRERPGTIVIDPYGHHLYWVLNGGKALRYGIGVGKAGFAWSGEAKIRVKRPWPIWRPPREMIERRPALEKYWEKGYPPGPKNPLGARALDLWQGSTDTLYRIHGTPDPNSIGKSVSSGCIRMWHQDIMDLYDRVPLYTKVVVLTKEA